MSKYVNVVIPPLHSPFTYGLEEGDREQVQVGDRVLVPLGNRQTAGFVVERHHRPPRRSSGEEVAVKPISSAAEPQPCFRQEDLEFYQWVAAYYGDSLASVIDLAVPNSVPKKFNLFLSANPTLKVENLRGKLQREIAQYVCKQNEPVSYSTLLKRFKGAAPAVKKLVAEAAFISCKEEILDHHINRSTPPAWAKQQITLNDEQLEAAKFVAEQSRAGRTSTILLHGVTGSGKTEVYIEAIKEALSCGKGAIVLVPEIALTPQLIDRFRARLGGEIAVLHSGLARRARWDSWRALLEGRNRVAIGARSAVFAPMRDLGVIIVDEEHDNSYKQNESLRYNARDLAIVRGKLACCPVVLGSATPSLETFLHALRKKYHYFTLPYKHHRTTKLAVEIIDLNRVKPWEMASRSVSPQMAQAIRDTLARGEQAFMLYNRRGFASYLQCENCEAVMECMNCSVTLTYHKRGNSLLCHYCSSSVVPPIFCPHCSKTHPQPGKLVQRGAGTERVYEELQQLFPEAVIDRMDRDAISDFEQYKRSLERVRANTTQILVGTQMIAKGHDMPNVTLVGVVDCDVGLHMPDFRASERVFQLLTQVSGRAGRGLMAGRVLLQTRVPKHASLQATVLQNFTAFAEKELVLRREMQYPPYSRLLRVIALSSVKEEPGQFLKAARVQLDALIKSEKLSVAVLGPAIAPLEKIKTKWRWHLLIKSRSVKPLQMLRKKLQSLQPKSKTLRFIYDIDPQEML
ncbi:MAG: primosomal protein N' [Deltaproteobacteria bacterium]|nr:primosomal protein N' [Deltaproteobacteria bacterium]